MAINNQREWEITRNEMEEFGRAIVAASKNIEHLSPALRTALQRGLFSQYEELFKELVSYLERRARYLSHDEQERIRPIFNELYFEVGKLAGIVGMPSKAPRMP